MNQAPLHELEDFSFSGGQAFFYEINEEDQLRIAFWNMESTKGTIILQSGRTEFIEKYYEVIEEFVSRGFAVAMMDWRGQGLSSRTAKDKRLGHIDKFETYDEDFKSVMNNYFQSKCPKTFYRLWPFYGRMSFDFLFYF